MKKVSTLLFLFLFSGASATQHIITFGATEEAPQYKPSNLSVNAGDTIVWQGNLSLEPVESTNIPEGAASFRASVGNSFYYVPLLAGHYSYTCSRPGYQSMRGEFTVAASIQNILFVGNEAASLYVQQINNINILHTVINDTSSTHFTLTLFDLSGRMLLNTPIELGVSGYILPQMRTGVYIARAVDDRNEVFATKIWQP